MTPACKVCRRRIALRPGATAVCTVRMTLDPDREAWNPAVKSLDAEEWLCDRCAPLLAPGLADEPSYARVLGTPLAETYRGWLDSYAQSETGRPIDAEVPPRRGGWE